MSDTKRIHFIEGEPSPYLRCRIFGHEYLTATAFEDVGEYDGEEVEVCRRCKSLKGRTWDGIVSLRTDSETPATTTTESDRSGEVSPPDS